MNESPAMSAIPRAVRPKVLFFDVNETLLDLTAMRASVGAALGGRAELLPLWFTTMLQHALVETLAGQYHDFGEVGAAALMMVAGNHGITLSREAALEAVKPIRSLPAHKDVAPALEALKNAGLRMATLTNSGQSAVEQQMHNAGLAQFFQTKLSVESVLVYKPHPLVYRTAAHKMGVRPDECMLVAAHGWDVAGALWAGMRAAFVARPGAQLYPLAPQPDIVAADMTEVADRLLRLPVA